MCGLISFDLGSDYSYSFPLRPLCKGEALELFSVKRQLISSQNGDWISPISVIQVFTNQVDNSSRMRKRMNNLTKWTSIQMHDLLLTE
jgi:hypothetical protein